MLEVSHYSDSMQANRSYAINIINSTVFKNKVHFAAMDEQLTCVLHVLEKGANLGLIWKKKFIFLKKCF